jgi:hypothetical protein
MNNVFQWLAQFVRAFFIATLCLGIHFCYYHPYGIDARICGAAR